MSDLVNPPKQRRWVRAAALVALTAAVSAAATSLVWVYGVRSSANDWNHEQWAALRVDAVQVADVVCESELTDTAPAPTDGRVETQLWYEGECLSQLDAQEVHDLVSSDGDSPWVPVADPFNGAGVWHASFVSAGAFMQVRGFDPDFTDDHDLYVDEHPTVFIEVTAAPPSVSTQLSDSMFSEGTDRFDGRVDEVAPLDPED